MRLLNVAGSLSSPLTHMNVSLRSFGRKLHLSRRGSRPPPAAQLRILDDPTTLSGSIAVNASAPPGSPRATRRRQRVAVVHVPVAGQDGFEFGHGTVLRGECKFSLVELAHWQAYHFFKIKNRMYFDRFFA